MGCGDLTRHPPGATASESTQVKLLPGGWPTQKQSGPLGATDPQRAIGLARQESFSQHDHPRRVSRQGSPFTCADANSHLRTKSR